MLEEAKTHVQALADMVGGIDPGLLGSEDALALLELGGAIERLGSGLTLLVAGRACAASGWKDQGHPGEGAWLAALSGCTVPEAIRTLESSRSLTDLPAAKAALMRGDLSAAQARTICSAGAVDPASDAALVEAAGQLSLAGLRRQAATVKAAAFVDTPAARLAAHERRYLRIWSDGTGSFRLSGAVAEDAGVLLQSAVRSRAAFVADEAARTGSPGEPPGAYEADALVALVTGDWRADSFSGPSGGRAPSADVTLHVSLEALRRGSLEGGERCEVPGVGPVSLAVARHHMGDAVTRLVITDGVDVASVCHMGRTVPAAVRSALQARDLHCVVPGCGVTCGLETDHWQVPYAEDGPSELWNLARLCRRHHRMKTFDGYVLGGGPGQWEWTGPD